MDPIIHPELGSITPDAHSQEWRTEPLKMGAFGYTARILIWPGRRKPSDEEIAAAVKIHQASPEYRTEIAGHMLKAYQESIRSEYLPIVDNPRYKNPPKASDLPEIHEPNGIWNLITGMNPVVIEGENLNLSFITIFDREHEFVVRFENNELHEVMMDG